MNVKKSLSRRIAHLEAEVRVARLEAEVQRLKRHAADEGGDDAGGGGGGKPSGKFIQFMEEEGGKRLRNPDTGNDVMLKSLKGPKGKKLQQDAFKKWLDQQDKKDKPKGGKPKGEKSKGEKPKGEKPKDEKPKDEKPSASSALLKPGSPTRKMLDLVLGASESSDTADQIMGDQKTFARNLHSLKDVWNDNTFRAFQDGIEAALEKGGGDKAIKEMVKAVTDWVSRNESTLADRMEDFDPEDLGGWLDDVKDRN